MNTWRPDRILRVLLRSTTANTDLIGVVLVIAQWMLLTDALRPRGVPPGD